MKWWKAIIIGCCLYFGLLGLCQQARYFLRFGYQFQSLVNIISYIPYFPFGANSIYHWIPSVLFWALIFAIIIRFLSVRLFKKFLDFELPVFQRGNEKYDIKRTLNYLLKIIIGLAIFFIVLWSSAGIISIILFMFIIGDTHGEIYTIAVPIYATILGSLCFLIFIFCTFFNIQITVKNNKK